MSDHLDNDKEELLENFEHEFDVATEKLQVTKPVFDGRLGDPALALKASLTRFLKHHIDQYTQSKLKAFAGEYKDALGSFTKDYETNMPTTTVQSREDLRQEVLEALKAIKEKYQL